MKYDIKKVNNEITVSVEIERRIFAKDPVQVINTNKVLELLKENGYNVNEYEIKKEGVCTTLNKDQILEDTWIFNRKEVKVAKSVKQPRRKPTPRKRTNQKNKLLGTKDLGGVQSQTQTDLPGQDKEISGE